MESFLGPIVGYESSSRIAKWWYNINFNILLLI